MVSGEEGAAAVRRWKAIALVSAVVAVAMVAGAVGWVLRGSAAAPSTAAFTGGGWLIAEQCGDTVNGFIITKAEVLVLDAAGTKLAAGTLMDPIMGAGGRGCRRDFVIDDIPGGRGIYTVQILRRHVTVTEAALRGNLAELSVPTLS